jgi:hypothetical protein
MSPARFAALSFSMLCLSLAFAQPAVAWCRLSTSMPLAGDSCASSGIGLAWQRQCVSFSVSQRMRPSPSLEEIRDTASASFAAWTAVSCGDQPIGIAVAQTNQLGMCSKPEYNTGARNANTIIFVEDWSARDLPADAFGLTLVWHNPDSGEIYDADMQINETIGPLAICQHACPLGAVDLQNVMTHEAGHVFGLGHSQVPGATMSARATVGETSKRTLEDDDRAGLCAIYGDFSPADCTPSEFIPDHGFSPQCADSADTGSKQSTTLGCNVSRPHAASAGADAPALRGVAWLFACALLCARQRRLRSRVAKSNAIPSATVK